MGTSQAIENLQFYKYGQIIELLVDFSLILPGGKEIIEEEINHQIRIYDNDENPQVLFLKKIMSKYNIIINQKIKKDEQEDIAEAIKKFGNKKLEAQEMCVMIFTITYIAIILIYIYLKV